ncbi:MAG: low affinity potassium transporter [Lichina confinis]|nr:MAG: low affinity potassium transporter [Lichina confinis]
MFGPWIQVWTWVRERYPGAVRQWSKLNFLTLHYIYIISCIVIGSVVIFVAGGIPYVDALFFASGATTQSGLNTIDVNNIKTFQQVALYIIALIANPMPVNSFVVFVRLYWFEKRFQNIANDVRRRRRLGSRTKSESKDERDLEREERGLRARDVSAPHRVQDSQLDRSADAPMEIEMDTELGRRKSKDELGTGTGTSAASSSTAGAGSRAEGETVTELSVSPSSRPAAPFRRDIVFADEVKAKDAHLASLPRLPMTLPAEHHIALLENQRNPKDKSTLRIPGPREFDRGEKPEELPEGEEGAELTRQRTAAAESVSQRLDVVEPNLDGRPPKRNVTIDESTSPCPKTADGRHVLGLRFRRRSSLAAPSVGRSITLAPTRVATSLSLRQTASRDPMPYLSWTPTIGRNSAFVDLTEDQREELGGIEYRALKTLAGILVGYIAFFNLLGVVCLLPWIVRSDEYGPVVDRNGQSRGWWGIFTPATMFQNLGYSITADSMISFQRAVLPMLLGSFLIIIGNTGFPCMLRLVIWIASLIVPATTQLWEELRFLLDHPRRCFTLLFPGDTTWWLFWVLVILNGVDVILFLTLDLQAAAVKSLPVGVRVMDGLFQATATRTAGLSCISISALHPAIQVSYMVMMYISVFPIAISIRKTNVYEERSLGIYAQTEDEAPIDKEPSYTGAHLRKQLSFDLWYIFLGLFFISIIEGNRIENKEDYAFTTFSVLFEVMSAYGNVGLSLGYPTINASFSGEFRTLSKLVIVAMQIRGRHRGLPYNLDRAILLPSESLHHKEEADARNRLARRNSNLSNMEAAGLDTVSASAPAVNGNGSTTAPKPPSIAGDKTKPS